MADTREALVALLHRAVYERVWVTRRGLEAQADAILAEFDVTPRGEHPTVDENYPGEDADENFRQTVIYRLTTFPQDSPEDHAEAFLAVLNLTQPTALPSVEDVARVLYARMRETTPNGSRHPDWDPESRFAEPWLGDARAVLALFEKGEDEPEWEYGVRWGDDGAVKNYGERERAEYMVAESHGDRLVRRRPARTIPAGEWEEVPSE